MAEFQWSSFEALSTELNQIDDTRIHHHSLAVQIEASDAMKLLYQRNLRRKGSLRGLDLHKLLETHHDAECTDIRDRIYGLLGLASFPANAPSMTADYSVPVRTLYTLTLQHFNDNYFFSVGRVPSIITLQKYAALLQRMFKLDHIDSLVTEELCKICPPRAQAGSRNPSSNLKGDWTELSDLAENRRIQNRIAQRNYRKMCSRNVIH